MSFSSTFTPGVYHRFNQLPPFFEGWYFKLVSADEKHKIAIIPGVILGKDAHAFVFRCWNWVQVDPFTTILSRFQNLQQITGILRSRSGTIILMRLIYKLRSIP